MNPQHYATYNPQQQQQFYGNAGNYATQSGGNSPALHTWTPPSPQEQQYYDALFAHVDEQRRNAINGQQAVAFFTRSHLDKAVLREVWSIADSQRRSELSRNEFYVAMRLIGMAQRGEHVSLQRFLQLASVQFPLPMMEGVPQAQMQPQPQMHPQPQTQSQSQAFGVPAQPQAAQSSAAFGSVQQTSHGAYGLTTDEKSKYDIVFQQYDTDRDGFLMGAEAVALFQMSGLDRNVLRDVWAMADVTQDSKLSVQEFYVAMHLIVCISKRGLPMPPTLPRELGETAFGTSGGVSAPDAFGSQTSGPPSHNGVPVQQEPVPPPKPEGMSAFDSLSTVEDVPLPSFASSTPKSSRDSSFNHVETAPSSHSGGFGEPTVPTPTGSIRGEFSAPTQQDFGHLSTPQTPSVASDTGRDRTNSASSMNSMSSFSGMGMAPLPPQPVQLLPPRSFGSSERIQMPQAQTAGFQTPQQSYSGFGTEGFGVPQSPTTPEKPFMSAEEEKMVVSQLDQQNEEVIQALAGVERKQTTIAMISEKLRELDELRHELVTLVMKREDLRSATNSTSAAIGNPAEEQTRHAVERSLRGLVENQKQLIQQLQYDISRNEGELEEAVLSAKLQQKLSLESQTPLIDAASPPVSGRGSVGAANAFAPAPLSLDGSNALPSPVATPNAPSLSAFSPDATDSSGFNGFSNFDSAPRSIASPSPSPAAAAPSGSPFSPTPAGNDSFNAFGDFAALPSTEAAPADASDTPGKSPFSPIPSPANASAFDSVVTPVSAGVPAHASSPAVEASPFSPFSPSPSPAATDGNAFTGFDVPNTADTPGNSPFSPVPSPAAANINSEQASVDFTAPTASPDNSPFSASPSPATTETPAFDAFPSEPVSNDSATLASSAVATENLIFSPVAADNSGVNDFSAAPDSIVSSEPAKQDSTGNLLPSPVASAPGRGLDAFGDINAPPASADSAPTSEKPSGNSPFSPVAADTNDFNSFSAFNAAPDSSTPSFSADKPVEASGHSPFSPVAQDSSSSSFEAFGDFNSASGSAAAPSEPTEAANTSGNSPFSPVAADSSGFGDFGDFNSASTAENTAAPIETKAETSGTSPFSPVAATEDSGFGEFGDFKTASASTDTETPTNTTEAIGSNGFGEFGDFSAAPSTTSEGFGDFDNFN